MTAWVKGVSSFYLHFRSFIGLYMSSNTPTIVVLLLLEKSTLRSALCSALDPLFCLLWFQISHWWVPYLGTLVTSLSYSPSALWTISLQSICNTLLTNCAKIPNFNSKHPYHIYLFFSLSPSFFSLLKFSFAWDHLLFYLAAHNSTWKPVHTLTFLVSLSVAFRLIPPFIFLRLLVLLLVLLLFFLGVLALVYVIPLLLLLVLFFLHEHVTHSLHCKAWMLLREAFSIGIRFVRKKKKPQEGKI